MKYQLDYDNLIFISSVLLPVITFLAVNYIAFREKVTHWRSLFSSMLLCLTVYYVLANNVHPWNLSALVALSVFSDYKYMLPWSFGVVLAYSAYQTFPYSENLWLVVVEYMMLAGWMFYERKNKLMKPLRH